MKELCVRCGKQTIYDQSTPVTGRRYYVEGSGQLCEGCWREVYDNEDRLILKTNCTVANGCIIFPEQPHSMSLFELTPAKAEDSGFAIYLKSDDVLVGHIAFDFKRSRFELSVGIKEQFQKHGYMTEAQKAVVDWLFENTNHDKIWALLGGITNEASRKILERTGFRKEQEGNLEWWVIEREYYKMNQKMEWIKECFPDYDILVEYDDIENKSKKRGNTQVKLT